MNDLQESTQESNDKRILLVIANFTAWIAPCTVWANNFKYKSYFLIVSSTTCMLSHMICLISVYIRAFLSDLLPAENPPIAHCFEATAVQLLE